MSDTGGALDQARLQELTAVDGSGDMLAGVIAELQESLDGMLSQLYAHLEAKEVEQARESAHLLAGRLLMVGARPAGQTLRRLEHALAEGEHESAAAMWPQLNETVSQARVALAEVQAK